ncbi:hypothetical protein P8452_67265 [Trifolium repens]|nr:hypothetical protein P8452_59042 [Trifolium repens]WJX84724.1 hypothetical protein P8452_67265 [Trifolium repens]
MWTFFLLLIYSLRHRETKNQWAHDDPAFVVICNLLLAVATLAYCAALRNLDLCLKLRLCNQWSFWCCLL